jgi:hypothetical protein
MKIVKKISDKTIRARILSHLSTSAEAWGLDMTRAKREEARAIALLKANQDMALALWKGGYISSHDLNMAKA